MKAKLHKLPVDSDASFLFKTLDCNYFGNPWHFHKEIELVLIAKSSGTRFIGDNVSTFEDGDLCLIGSNIPHLYRNSEAYYAKNSKLKAKSIFIHFTRDFLGNHFFDVPEMKQINKLLQKLSLAVEIQGETRQVVTESLHRMLDETPVQRLLSLLGILANLAQSSELNSLLSPGFSANTSGDSEKINSAFQFIMKNYTNQIYIHDIATKLNMSVPAFSRYFKHHTRKTFSDFVTEIRIGHSCKMLMEDDYNISEISYQSGFDNLSNFYRHFKKITGVIPKEYRSRFLNTVDD